MRSAPDMPVPTFIGGPIDREACTLGMKMASNDV